MKFKRSGLIFFLLGTFLVLLFVWQEKEKLLTGFVKNVIDRMGQTAGMNVAVQSVTLRFPFSLEMRGVSVRGESFSLSASTGRIRLPFRVLFRGERSQDTIFLEIDDGELVTSLRNPLEWLSSFPFSQWPRLQMTLRRLRLHGGVSFEPLDIWLQNARDGVELAIQSKTWRALGFLTERGNIRWEARTLQSKALCRGHLDLGTGEIHMEVEGEKPVALDGRLSWGNERIELTALTVERGGVKLAGKASIGLSKGFPLVFEGVAQDKEKNQSFSFSFHGEQISSLWDWAGTITVQSLDGKASARGRFSLQGEKRSFTVFLDSLTLFETTGQGTLRGSWSEEGVHLSLEQFQIHFPEEGFFLHGHGTVTGTFHWDKRDLRGKAFLRSDRLRLGHFVVESPQIDLEVMPTGVFLSGHGQLWDGTLGVTGSFQNGNLVLEGTLQGMRVEHFTSSPLNGFLSGDLCFEYQDEKASLVLALTEGNLAWKDTELGEVVGGQIIYQDGKFLGKEIVVKRDNGVIRGNLEIEGQNLAGTFEMVEYPFSYRWGDEEILCSLQGQSHIQGTQDRWTVGLSLSSSWNLGGRQSGVFTLQGTLSDKTLSVGEFSCEWRDGWVKLSGEVDMYEKISLQGEISRLSLPANQLGWSGNLHSLRFTLSGPWQEVDFVFEAEGEDFALLGQPLGESLVLQMEGTIPLPKNTSEALSVQQYFDPRYFRKGEVVIRKVNLASLGVDFLRRYHGEGVTDLVFRLEPEKKRWSFSSHNLTLSFPGYVEFQGEMVGEYDGETLDIKKLSLIDRNKNIALNGMGKFDMEDKTLDFRLAGEVDTVFSWKEDQWRFYGKGKGTVVVTGTTDNPHLSGELFLGQGEVYEKDTLFASFSAVQAKFTADVLHILTGQGRVGGVEGRISGAISLREADLRFEIEGASIFPDFAEALEGLWKGELFLSGTWNDLKLHGELSLQEGLLDLREKRNRGSWSLAEALANWERTVPVAVELILSTVGILEVKTRFLDLGLAGKLSVNGRGKDLTVEGKLEVVRGTYDLVMVKFPLQGAVFFNSLGGFEPQLALEGEKEVGRYRIYLSATGALSDYQMVLRSEPLLSQEEILSLLFLGREDAYLALDTLNVAPLLLKGLQFLLRGNFDVLSRLPFFEVIEFDLVNFSRFTIGKRLGKNIALGYTQELGGDKKSSWSVEIDLSREWSFKGELGSQGTTEWLLEFRTRF